MANCSMLTRNLQYSFLRLCSKNCDSVNARFSSSFGLKKIRKTPIKFLVASVPLTAVGAGYYYFRTKRIEPNYATSSPEHAFLTSKPEVSISRTVNFKEIDQNLNLTLFQYPTCPFCCKVRAFLDYYGLPYEVVEVDPILKQQTAWTTYKKVPILLAKVDGGYQQLNDSSMIISALKSHLINKERDLKEIVGYYPISVFKNSDGSVKTNIGNAYFLMYETLPKHLSTEQVKEEKKWREWVDNSLVHVLSPNVYRTFDEALQSFLWFSEVGEWEKLFPAWERNVIVYLGSFAMWIISKNLKKRHNLKQDVRESLYDECRLWMKQISAKKTTFMGGNSPNLADLAAYGVLSSIEGCSAFQDLLKNTNIGNWYFPMKQAVNNHEGRKELNL